MLFTIKIGSSRKIWNSGRLAEKSALAEISMPHLAGLECARPGNFSDAYQHDDKEKICKFFLLLRQKTTNPKI